MAIGYESFDIGKVSDEAGGQRWLVGHENVKQQGNDDCVLCLSFDKICFAFYSTVWNKC